MVALVWTLADLTLVLATVVAMEGVAWASHRYVMHGWLWSWHRDHHEPHADFWERNDRFALVGAAISIGFFAAGSSLVLGPRAWPPATAIGLGVMLYGAIYTLVHDGLVHQRWFRWVPKRGYAKRLVQAHKLHHASLGKEGGVSFGFVFAPRPETLKRKLAEQARDGRVRLRQAV